MMVERKTTPVTIYTLQRFSGKLHETKLLVVRHRDMGDFLPQYIALVVAVIRAPHQIVILLMISQAYIRASSTDGR